MTETERQQVAEAILVFLRDRFPGLGEEVDSSTPLLDGGAVDSIGILELMMFVGDRYGFEIDDADFVPENFETVEALVNLVERHVAQAEVGR